MSEAFCFKSGVSLTSDIIYNAPLDIELVKNSALHSQYEVSFYNLTLKQKLKLPTSKFVIVYDHEHACVLVNEIGGTQTLFDSLGSSHISEALCAIAEPAHDHVRALQQETRKDCLFYCVSYIRLRLARAHADSVQLLRRLSSRRVRELALVVLELIKVKALCHY